MLTPDFSIGSSLGLWGLNSPWALVIESGFLAAMLLVSVVYWLLVLVKSEVEFDRLVLCRRIELWINFQQSF